MPTTANMSLVYPADHTETDTWGPILNTLFGVIDEHDHSVGKGVKVPSGGLKINADVSWSFGGTQYAITDMKALDFTPVAASGITSYSSALFVNSSDSNNLYFRNSGGTNVKITDGGTLNISIVGGIGGDYQTVGALFSFDDATDSYWAQQQGSPRPWARLRVGDVDIYETAASISNRVRLKSPSALAASYDITWLAALPASTMPLQVSNAGVLSASNTFAGELTAPDFNYTTAQNLILPASMAEDRLGTHTKSTGASSGAMNRFLIAASANPLVWPLPTRVGDRITGYTLYVRKRTDNTNTIASRIFYTTSSNGIETGGSAGTSSAANAPGYVTLTESTTLDHTAADIQFYLVFTPGGGVTPNADEVFHVSLNLTRP